MHKAITKQTHNQNTTYQPLNKKITDQTNQQKLQVNKQLIKQINKQPNNQTTT